MLEEKELNLIAEKVYSVRELNSIVRAMINYEFPDLLWVHGEIQDYDRNKHKQDIYFRLCEKHPEADEVISSATAVIFSDRKKWLFEVFKQNNIDFELKDGLEVKLLCKPDFFIRSGTFVLIVEDIDTVYTIGKLAQNKQKLIEELKLRGLLDRNKMLPLPAVMLNIGLITSYNSAAYNDFVSELQRSGYGFKIYLYNVFVQGKNVEQDISNGIEMLNRLKFLDVIVITRGGGSTQDLSWFDNRRIAEKIAYSRLPVLTGIGHEINITVADLCAHTYFKTPTAVAQYIVNTVKTFIDSLQQRFDSIITYTQEFVKNEMKTLELKTTSLDSQTHKLFRQHIEFIASMSKEIILYPENSIRNLTKELQNRTKELPLRVKYFLEAQKKEVNHIEKVISSFDPMNVVKRGFSITKLKDGRILRSIRDVKRDDTITTIIVDGVVSSVVEEVEKQDTH
jgi:exodeoxyribonuclease VII large subunit